jgi:hypothetical protein
VSNRPSDPDQNLPEGATALGRDWWVFDIALRLGRELEPEMGRDKAREILLLRHIKHRYPTFPEGPVFASETPDFIVCPEGGSGRVGIELIEVLRGRRRASLLPA